MKSVPSLTFSVPLNKLQSFVEGPVTHSPPQPVQSAPPDAGIRQFDAPRAVSVPVRDARQFDLQLLPAPNVREPEVVARTKDNKRDLKGRRYVNVLLPKALAKRLALVADLWDVQMSKVVEEALLEHLERRAGDSLNSLSSLLSPRH